MVAMTIMLLCGIKRLLNSKQLDKEMLRNLPEPRNR